MAQPAKKSTRILELDTLRALAAINLLLFHFTHVYEAKYGYLSPLGFEFPWGKYGVVLFLMLSGFVNAMTITRKQNPREFLASRVMRIFPSFWIVLAINGFLVCITPLTNSTFTWDQWLANLTIVPNLFGYECIEPVTWTLQVEVLFYGVLLLMFVTRQLNSPIRTTGLLLLACLTICLPLRNGTLVGGPTVESIHQITREIMILEYLPLFLMGVLLNEIKGRRGSLVMNLVAIGICLAVFHTVDRFDHNPAATLLLAGMVGLSAFGKLPPLRTRPLIFISSISYSLYLLHNNLGSAIIYHLNHAGIPPVVCMVLATALVILISTVTTFYVERPISQLLRRAWEAYKSWEISKAPEAATQPGRQMTTSIPVE